MASDYVQLGSLVPCQKKVIKDFDSELDRNDSRELRLNTPPENENTDAVNRNLRRNPSALSRHPSDYLRSASVADLATNRDRERHKVLKSVAEGIYKRGMRPSLQERLGSEETNEELDPSIVFSQLLQHVRMDPDGGIINLRNQSTDNLQHSKIKALRKSPFEQLLAMFGLFRAIANPCLVMYFAGSMLHGLYFQEDWVQKLERHTATMRVPLPMMECFAITAFAELVSILYFVLRGLWHILEAFQWTSTNATLDPKYIAMAEFYWQDVPYLQSFSALAPLSVVHPNLLTKNVKAYSLSEDIARRRLERFLCVSERLEDEAEGQATWSDEEIVHSVLCAIVKYDFAENENMRYVEVNEHLESTPCEILQYLQNSKVAKDPEYCRQNGLDPDGTSCCQVCFLTWVQSLVMVVFGVSCFLAGSVAFLTKGVRAFVLLSDQEVNAFVPLAFCFAFLNQAMGIIPLTRLLSWRLECFIFGGTDAFVSSEEMFVMRVYFGSLAEAVWKSDQFSWFNKMCIMLHLDDDDLQQLVLENASQAKYLLVQQVIRYMEDVNSSNWLNCDKAFKSKVLALAG